MHLTRGPRPRFSVGLVMAAGHLAAGNPAGVAGGLKVTPTPSLNPKP